MDPRSPVRVKVRGTSGCALFKHIESVDPRVAEGLKRDSSLPFVPSAPPGNQLKPSSNGSASSSSAQPPMSREDFERLMENEKRRAITDPFQIFLYDARAMHKKGNFKGLQGDVILSRIRDLLDKGASELNLSGFVLFDDFCIELLAPYVCAKSCRLTSVNLSGTQIGVQGAIALGKAAAMNPLLQTLQLSLENPVPVLTIRREAQSASHSVELRSKRFSHLDAAALGALVEKERKLERLDVSENELTGARTNVFHGIGTLLQGLKRCLHLKELKYVLNTCVPNTNGWLRMTLPPPLFCHLL